MVGTSNRTYTACTCCNTNRTITSMTSQTHPLTAFLDGSILSIIDLIYYSWSLGRKTKRHSVLCLSHHSTEMLGICQSYTDIDKKRRWNTIRNAVLLFMLHYWTIAYTVSVWILPPWILLTVINLPLITIYHFYFISFPYNSLFLALNRILSPNSHLHLLLLAYEVTVSRLHE